MTHRSITRADPVVERTDVVLEAGGASDHDHRVGFYETDTFLADTVARFLVPVLRAGEAVMVVATAAHRHDFEIALRDAGIDLDDAAREGRYLVFDARDLLSRFMVARGPDVTRFQHAVGAAMDQASRGGRQVSVFGEMVALLWGDGQAAAAIALEEMWDDLAVTRSFGLLCAYPMRAFDDESSAAGFRAICDQHTTVIPSDGFLPVPGPVEPLRVIVQLQQRTVALQAEVLRLRSKEQGMAAPARDLAGDQRDRVSAQRDDASDDRDDAGDRRDRAAEERDQAAEERDQSAERSEILASRGISAPEAVRPTAFTRREAAADRRRASHDRRDAAAERSQALLERSEALADRGASARERASFRHDDLTGVYRRGPGMIELDHAITRAKLAGRPLILAFVDVDHLKTINDTRGHAAGDRMLRGVATSLRGHLRADDLIVRYGGDEFICVIPGQSLSSVVKRLKLVNAALAGDLEPGSVTAGVAELLPNDSPADLVARADAALYRRRQKQRSTRHN